MVDVIMPQMGESIAEGTVTKWMKNVGDRVERDEPLFEISTDKVDAEIPSPASGILKEIRVAPGTTVPINTVVGVIAAEGEAAAPAAAAALLRPPLPRRGGPCRSADSAGRPAPRRPLPPPHPPLPRAPRFLHSRRVPLRPARRRPDPSRRPSPRFPPAAWPSRPNGRLPLPRLPAT